MASRRLLLGLLLVALPAVAEPLVGAGVGNADTLVTEGSRLFNRKDYKKAIDSLYRATRANPANTTVYLQLARAYMLNKQLTRACYAYRVYLKVTPDTPDRKKAVAESDQCERRLKGARNEPPDPTPRYVETRAAFFAALDKSLLLGPGAAVEALRTLVADGFLGPELGDMAQKLGAAAVAEAEGIYKRAVALEKVPAEVLRSARLLFQIANDVGTSPADARARYLDGLAELAERNFKRAEQLFLEAAKTDPTNREYHFARAVTLFQAGDRPGALKVLDAEMKDDPRTAVLRVALSLGHSSDSGAAELEKLLFTTRYPPEK